MGMLFILVTWMGDTVLIIDYTKNEDKFAGLTVRGVKMEVERRSSTVRKEDIDLLFGGQRLTNDDAKLTDLKIVNESHLIALKVDQADKKMHKIMYQGQAFDVVFSLSSPTLYLKDAIQAQLKVPFSLQSLWFNGKPIDQENDLATLASKGITDTDAIELKLKTHMQTAA
jgi:hypothetical protein